MVNGGVRAKTQSAKQQERFSSCSNKVYSIKMHSTKVFELRILKAIIIERFSNIILVRGEIETT